MRELPSSGVVGPRALRISAAIVLLWSSAAFAQSGLAPELLPIFERAQAGDPRAQFAVASAYDTGRRAPRNGEEAMRWYRAAADQGLAEAQNSVGSGLQAAKRYDEAREWYEKAAAQHHARATNNLAYLYDLGLGVQRDRQKAAQLYGAAAELGHAEAMWNLALMYEGAQLGARDLVQACIWNLRARAYLTASDQRLTPLSEKLEKYLDRSLDATALSQCQEQSAGWVPRDLAQRSDLGPTLSPPK